MAWLVAAVSTSFIVGVAVSPLFEYSFSGIGWLIIALALLIPALVNLRVYLLLFGISAGILLGFYRGSLAGVEVSEYSQYYGQEVIMTGRVSEDSSFGSSGDQRFRLDKVRIDTTELSAAVWVSLAIPSDIKRGDTVRVEGRLSEGFGNIPASMYRAEIVAIERPYPGDVGRRMRDWFGAGAHATMDQSDANFALAFLLGQKLELADGLEENLITVGLIHAVVASGYHLTVLVGVVKRLFVSISKYLTALFSAAVIGGFILITGFSPSMTRAGLVTGLSLVAWYYGRRVHPVVLLAFTAALTVLYKPQYAWGDIGWLLSYTSFIGVIILAPLVHRYFWGKNRPNLLQELLIVTLAAQLLTLPIVIYVFGYYSVYALIANLLVVPLIPLIMLVTFLAGVSGLIFAPAGLLFGAITSWLLTYVITVVNYLAGLPNARSEVEVSIAWIVASYIGILLGMLLLWRKTKHNFRDTDPIIGTL